MRVVAGICLVVLVALGVGPRTGRYQTLNVLSASMGKRMPPGALAVFTKQTRADVRPGHVIAFTSPQGVTTTHRVLWMIEEGTHPVVQTKGDANDAQDQYTVRLDSDPVWRLRLAVPHLGRLLSVLRGPVLRIVLVGVVPALLAAAWLSTIWSRTDEERGPWIQYRWA